MGNITYANKVALHTDSSVDNKYKCTAADMNMIKSVVNGKQDTLTAGTGIDITNNVISNTQTSAEWGNITGTLSDQTDLKNALDDKQDELVSGTNIKTINNASILGSGNITINAEDEVEISTTQPTGNETVWINPNESVNVYGSYISNTYGTSQTIGYSQEYVNNCNTYSTSEIKTNKRWIDNKPIYRKNLTVNTGTTLDLWSSIAHNISNVDFIMIINAFFVNGNSDKEMLPNSDTQVAINNTNIRLVLRNASMKNRNMTLIVEYTKTTD